MIHFETILAFKESVNLYYHEHVYNLKLLQFTELSTYSDCIIILNIEKKNLPVKVIKIC